MAKREPKLFLFFNDVSTDEPTLIYDGRAKRMLSDALDMLRKIGNLTADANVEVRTRPLRLPDGNQPSLVAVIGSKLLGGTRCRICMPTSKAFYASTTFGERRQYDIADLDGAIADTLGNVTLRNDTELAPVSTGHLA